MSHRETACSCRKILQGVASRQQMYVLFNRHGQAPFDDDRISGRRSAGEWFEISEADHDRMFEILPPLFVRGDMFAMREFLAGRVTSVFFALAIDGVPRWFHGYCDLSDPSSPMTMRTAIINREERPVRTLSRAEKLEHIWSLTSADYRAYADARFAPALCGRQIIIVYSAGQGNIWKLLEELSDEEIAAKLPVQFRNLPNAAAA